MLLVICSGPRVYLVQFMRWHSYRKHCTLPLDRQAMLASHCIAQFSI